MEYEEETSDEIKDGGEFEKEKKRFYKQKEDLSGSFLNVGEAKVDLIKYIEGTKTELYKNIADAKIELYKNIADARVEMIRWAVGIGFFAILGIIVAAVLHIIAK